MRLRSERRKSEQVLDNTAIRLRDKMEVMEEIEACLAAKKMEERIMGCMPCGIILYLRLLSPGFLDPLYGNVLGAAVMTAVWLSMWRRFGWERRLWILRCKYVDIWLCFSGLMWIFLLVHAGEEDGKNPVKEWRDHL